MNVLSRENNERERFSIFDFFSPIQYWIVRISLTSWVGFLAFLNSSFSRMLPVPITMESYRLKNGDVMLIENGILDVMFIQWLSISRISEFGSLFFWKLRNFDFYCLPRASFSPLYTPCEMQQMMSHFATLKLHVFCACWSAKIKRYTNWNFHLHILYEHCWRMRVDGREPHHMNGQWWRKWWR